ncbi:unnamed protein product, partial [Symbiodinium sp. KB8]
SGEVGGPAAVYKVGRPGCRPRKSAPELPEKVPELRPTPSQLSVAASHPGAKTWSLRCASEPSLASGRCPRSRRSSQSTDGHRSRRGSASAVSLSCLSCKTSSCGSQALRSTVLDLELMLERERREEAERELAELKTKLASLESRA